jgi:hypothetical protein
VAEIRAALATLDSDWVFRYGDALALLADALRAAGQEDEARTTAEETLGVFERKGDIPSARRARAFLAGTAGFWEIEDRG